MLKERILTLPLNDDYEHDYEREKKCEAGVPPAIFDYKHEHENQRLAFRARARNRNRNRKRNSNPSEMPPC